jgi:hypothetical protein
MRQLLMAPITTIVGCIQQSLQLQEQVILARLRLGDQPGDCAKLYAGRSVYLCSQRGGDASICLPTQ